MKNRIAYRIVIYVIVLAIIASIAFAPNAGKEDPDIAYWIIGGILFAGWIAFVIVNEIMVYRKLKKVSNK